MKRQRSKAFRLDNEVTAIRARDFLARHGGPGTEEPHEGKSADGRSGWWEMGAADGYKLRCDWRRSGNEEQLNFSEVAPG